MNDKFSGLLRELWTFGRENDSRTSERSQRMLNITPDTGEFLLVLVRAMKARRSLEIGTSNGYSTLWLAHAVEPLKGKVTTLEIAPHKAEMARANFERAGLAAYIDLQLGNAGDLMGRQAPASFDFIFLDTSREQYVPWWPTVDSILAPGGLIVADNAVSHAGEMEAFMQLVRRAPGFRTSLVPVGNGEFLALKEA
jgi:predicted O-methyltransferase YrrM